MIQVKKKRCKGISKAIGYGCGEIKYTHRYGLCENCFKEWLFSNDGHETLMKSIITGKKKFDKEIKSKKTKSVNANKSMAKLIQEARSPYQKLIRIRDHGQNCICCDNPLPFNIGDYDGGHMYSAESYTGLIFHPDNCHGQRTYCNKYLHGNESGYMEGIKKRIGVSRYNNLKSSKNSLKTFKWDKCKVIELKKYYNKELKLVEKGLKDINDVDLTIGIIKI